MKYLNVRLNDEEYNKIKQIQKKISEKRNEFIGFQVPEDTISETIRTIINLSYNQIILSNKSDT